MKLIAEMTAEDQAKHALNKAMATPEVIKLALCLQNIAFYGVRYPITENPAPLYLHMAISIHQNEHVKDRLADLIRPMQSDRCCCGECC